MKGKWKRGIGGSWMGVKVISLVFVGSVFRRKISLFERIESLNTGIIVWSLELYFFSR